MGIRHVLFHLGLATLAVASTINPRAARSNSPSVTVQNGTLNGLYSAPYDQDFFLGIPFAQPPLGPLRLNNPEPLQASFGSRDATQYGPACASYLFNDNWGLPYSEDCLTINIIRPAGLTNESCLPIAMWIYGGGDITGSGSVTRYNMSFLVQNSVEMGKPIIGVTFNYRLAHWGWLSSDVIQKAGTTNLGLKDQRLALHWIQENIAAFGGDPRKVTIFGQSAGAANIAYQSILYNGRDDGLYRGMIAESIAPASNLTNTTLYNEFYQRVIDAAGCGPTANFASLQCLRQVPFAQLNQAFNETTAISVSTWGPVVDGDLLTDIFSDAYSKGKFNRKPFLLGQNTDEGTSFAPKGINTTEQFGAAIVNLGPNAQGVRAIESLYPDDPALGIPTTLSGRPPPDTPYGQQWKRAAAFWGDYSIFALRRLVNQVFTQYGVKSYAYRFNALPANTPDYIGVTHFAEVAFVYDNTQGLGYDPPLRSDPFAGRPPSYFALAKLMSRMWVSFVHDLDPNHHGIPNIAHWPAYGDTKTPQGFVFDANVTSHTEDDTYRAAGIQWIINHSKSQFHR